MCVNCTSCSGSVVCCCAVAVFGVGFVFLVTGIGIGLSVSSRIISTSSIIGILALVSESGTTCTGVIVCRLVVVIAAPSVRVSRDLTGRNTRRGILGTSVSGLGLWELLTRTASPPFWIELTLAVRWYWGWSSVLVDAGQLKHRRLSANETVCSDRIAVLWGCGMFWQRLPADNRLLWSVFNIGLVSYRVTPPTARLAFQHVCNTCISSVRDDYPDTLFDDGS